MLDYIKTTVIEQKVVKIQGQAKTARRLLSKAEKLDILKSEGKTRNKVYFR